MKRVAFIIIGVAVIAGAYFGIARPLFGDAAQSVPQADAAANEEKDGGVVALRSVDTVVPRSGERFRC